MNGKKVGLVPKIFVAALVAVAVIILILYICGGRYTKDELGNKFLGFTSETAEGRTLKSGTIYYADGITAKVAAHGQVVKFEDGTEVGNANRLEFSNGEIYEGKMNGLHMSGKGRFTWTNEDKYEGDFVNDAFTGNGVQYWADGSLYIGQFADSKKNGTGVYIWEDCDTSDLSKYSYEKLAGIEINSESVKTLPEGTWFAGNFTENKKSGYGVYHYGSGDVYAGNFDSDLKSGEGKFFFASGESYEGSFKDDERAGKGTYKWADGKIYEGDFAENTLNGYGKYTWPDGSTEEGYFEDGKKTEAPAKQETDKDEAENGGDAE